MASKKGKEASYRRMVRLREVKERYQVALMQDLLFGVERERRAPSPPDPEMAAPAKFIVDALLQANSAHAVAVAQAKSEGVERVVTGITISAPDDIEQEEYERHTDYYKRCVSPLWSIRPVDVDGRPGWLLERAS